MIPRFASLLPRTDFLLFDTRPGQPFAELRLRKAVALALHRAGVAKMGGPGIAEPVDHLLPRTVPGYRSARIFPLRSNPTALERARSLSRGLVPAKVTLATLNRSPWLDRAAFVAQTLKQINVEVDVKVYPSPIFCFDNPADDDLMVDRWSADYPDPAGLFRYLAKPRPPYSCAPLKPMLAERWQRRIRAAERLTGDARLRAFGVLDIALSRDGLPAVALLQPYDLNLFSSRIGCFRPHRVYQVDIGALCLR